MAAWIVGGGGGGSAIAAALADGGAEHLYLTERDSARVSAVAERLRGFCPKVSIGVAATPPDPVDFAVNATRAGCRPRIRCRLTRVASRSGPWFAKSSRSPGTRRCLSARRHTLHRQIPMYLDLLRIRYADEQTVSEIAAAALLSATRRAR